eukprot:360019-Chlamydomonas_euryale.AAC.2
MQQGFYQHLARLPVQGTFRRRCSDLWPKAKLCVARQLEKVPKGGATTGTFLMASPDCKAVHPRKVLNVSVTPSQLQLFHVAIFRN